MRAFSSALIFICAPAIAQLNTPVQDLQLGSTSYVSTSNRINFVASIDSTSILNKDSSAKSANTNTIDSSADTQANGSAAMPITCSGNTEPPGRTSKFVCSIVGGVEQVDLSSLPSETEPFLRLYLQSGALHPRKAYPSEDMGTFRLWGSIRLLGAPNQSDTNGIFSVFADPTGQITSQKLSSVGIATDFTFGPAYRLASWPNSNNSIDFILGFGATTPLQSNKVTQAFVAPPFGTAECNILYNKFESEFSMPVYGIKKTTNGVGTGSTTACLINTNAPSTSNGTTTYAPINTVAFSNEDRTSFLLKDLVGIRFNHTLPADSNKGCTNDSACYLGTLDFEFGMDSAITGGVFRGNRWIFKADGVYPIVATGIGTLYIFGSFSTRIERNATDNTPLILQAATLSTLTGTGNGAVPNVNTVVLPLRQPDRDFYRIGVGIDVLSLFKAKSKT